MPPFYEAKTATCAANGEPRCCALGCTAPRLAKLILRSGLVRYFFLHSGPSLASCFSVICAPPAALRAADFSAFIGVQLVHCDGTLASAKIASTGHSGTHAS